MLLIKPKTFPQPNLEVVTIEKLDIIINANRNASFEAFQAEIVINFIDSNGKVYSFSNLSIGALALKFEGLGDTPTLAKTKANQTILGLITQNKQQSLPIYKNLAIAYGYEVLDFEA